jgi:hypothetical protein
LKKSGKMVTKSHLLKLRINMVPALGTYIV